MDDFLKIIATLVTFFFVFQLAKKLTGIERFSFLSARHGRYGAVDGLRGYLAMAVFIHHFIITWYWKNTGFWERPPEDYFQNYGKVGVAIFFMITGFLFISKILNNRENINWLRLFESRVFRIYPLYLFALLVITLNVLVNTKFELNVYAFAIIKQYLKWFIFFGNEINGFSDTRKIIAGVDWTLKYEWIFYISLPLIAKVISYGKGASVFLVFACLLVFEFPIRYLGISTVFFILFAVGGVCAYFIKARLFDEINFHRKSVSLVSFLLLVFTLIYPNTFDLWHVVAMSLFFLLVSQGNDMFGLFRQIPSVLLGEISYSIYLLHGALLYLLFSQLTIFSLDQWPLSTYLLLMPIVAGIVVIMSVFTYLSIEMPSMSLGRHYFFSRKIEALVSKYAEKNPKE